MNYKTFNRIAKEHGYKGRAMNSDEKVAKKYLKYLKEKKGKAPIPIDYLYNSISNRLVLKDNYVRQNGLLRGAYNNKFSLTENVLGRYVAPPSQDIFTQTNGDTGNLTDMPYWIEWIKSKWSVIRGKRIKIRLWISEGEIYEEKYWDVDNVDFNTSIIPLFIKRMIYKSDKSDDDPFFVRIADMRGLGAMEISILTAIESNTEIEQYFLDGIQHCVLDPISKIITNFMMEAKSEHTKKKYKTYINKIEGKPYKNGTRGIGFKSIYIDGIDKEGLQLVCDAIKCRIKIYSPFVLFSEIGTKDTIFDMKCKGEVSFTFSFINTRLNHLEVLVNDVETSLDLTNMVCISYNDNVELEADEMIAKLKWCENNIDYYPYTEKLGIPRRIMTAEVNYALVDDSKEIINTFENNNNLIYNRISTNDPYNDFILSGVHTNGSCEFNQHKIGEMTTHIDMEKAFYNHKECPYYHSDRAFLSRPSMYRNFQQEGINEELKDWNDRYYKKHSIRPTDKYDNLIKAYCCYNVGYYRIQNLNAEKLLINDYNAWSIVSHMGLQERYEDGETYNQIDYQNDFGIYKDNGVYTHLDIMLLCELGIDFIIVDGITGNSQEIEWGNDMLRKFKNGKECDNGIRLYASWTGIQIICSTTRSYNIKQDVKYLKAMARASHSIGRNDKFHIYKEKIGNKVEYVNRARVSYDIGQTKHRAHIAGYTYAYQRISTILQLLKFDVNNIYKVNTDGIYYKGKEPTLVSTFRREDKLYPANVCSPYGYSSHKYNIGENSFVYDNLGSEIYDDVNMLLGAGGTGKTYRCMNDEGLLKAGYLPHSNKLASSQTQWKGFKAPYQHLLLDNPRLLSKVLSCNTLFIDEASTLNVCDYKKIIKLCKGIRLIFMGDLGYQCEPIKPKNTSNYWIDYNEDIILDMMDRIETLEFNYRFQNCDNQRKMCKTYRKNVNKDFSQLLLFCLDNYGYIDYETFYKECKFEDIVLSSRHINKDAITKKLSTILPPKYIITKKRVLDGITYNKGDVYYELPPINSGGFEICYAYTIHSIQGETLLDNQNLYILVDNMICKKVLYTAISRAKYFKQVKFVKL